VLLSPHEIKRMLISSSRHTMTQNLGDWQGQTLSGRGSTAPANAESLSEFSVRSARWWSDVITAYVDSLTSAARETESRKDSIPQPACVLVVSHGGYISRLISNLVQSGKVRCAQGVVVNGKCWNASISVIDVYGDGQGVLVSYSDTTHLKVDLVQTNADVINQ